MLTHTEAINYVIKKKRFKSYLEIGVNDRAKNFDLINCQFKIGIDPDANAKSNFTGTSDDFFALPKINFDCIFIDGLHHYDQVLKDLLNAMECLNNGGVILIHDTDPKEERFAIVPRKERGRWNGDVYMIIPHLKQLGLDYRTLNYEANGVTVCKMGGVKEQINHFKDFSDFLSRRAELNLISKTEFEAWI